jgi:hypothetical protein
MKLIVFACVSLLLAVGNWQAPLLAQTHSLGPRAEGNIKGLVLDPRNSRVAGAKITLENKSYRVEALSNDEGAFELKVPAGEYQLKVEGEGFEVYIKKRVRIKADKTETISVAVAVRAAPGVMKLK